MVCISSIEQAVIHSQNNQGGKYNDNQLAEFDLGTKTFVDRGLNALPKEVYGFSQYFTQIESLLYMIDPQDSMINVYQLSDRNLVTNYSVIPINVGQYGCLTSSSTQLFVIGGAATSSSNSLDSIQILNIQTKDWSEGPTMLRARERFSCIMHPSDSSVLFAIGGENNLHGYLKSIEKINIDSGTKEYINDLTVPLLDTRAISYGESIFVIGGYDNLYNVRDLVHIIEPNTGGVTVSDDLLAYGVYGVAAVAVNDTIYAFGGVVEPSNIVDTWMEYKMYVLRYFADNQ